MNSRPFGNGEDIILSYVVCLKNHGKLHKVYNMPVTELSAPFGIYDTYFKEHLVHRNKLLKVCEQWLLKNRLT
jgi:hypothetical protein